MSQKHKRSIKNYLINKSFQLKFLFRFFFFSFIVLSIGGLLQYYIANKTVLNKLKEINKESQERREIVKQFVKRHQHATDPRSSRLPPALKSLMQSTFYNYNKFLKSEIRFINRQIEHAENVLISNIKEHRSAFWGSVVLVGLVINIAFSLIYGIFLSHRIAGNHYRLQKFAKQLQDKDLATPLYVRKKDFFQETAYELDLARSSIQMDLRKAREKDTSILSNYHL